MAKNAILTYSRVLESFLEYYKGYYEEISLEKIDSAFIVLCLLSHRIILPLIRGGLWEKIMCLDWPSKGIFLQKNIL